MTKSGIIRSGRLLELEAVAAVARRRNFRRAAIDVGLSATALSRTVAAVEARLGIQLFVRTTRSVALTAAGERFVSRILPALDEIGIALGETAHARDAPSGVIRINCSSGAAHRLLEPILLPFLDRHPDISVDLVVDSRRVDIIAEGFDAGVRQAASVPTEMVSVPLTGPARFVVVAAPDYLGSRSPPQHPDDLMLHRCIRIRLANGGGYAWEFTKAGEHIEIDVPGVLTLDDPALMRRAALAGAGLAYLVDWRVAGDIDAGRLIPVLTDWSPQEQGLCLYHPSRRHPSAALRALIAHVTAALPSSV